MAKKTSKASGASPQPPAQWETQISQLDRELVKLLNQRAEATRQLAEAAGPQGIADPRDRAADESCLHQAEHANHGPLPNKTIRAVFRELLSGTRCLLHQLRVCYLGPEFSYSHLAAVKQFGTSAELVPVVAISTVFDAVHRGQADFGLVPIENSTDGRVADTLEMFARLPLKICGEVQLCIHHHLLGKCRQSEIKEVYSKPQALSQCRAFLAQHLPNASAVEIASTAAAARLAASKPGAAAIASRQAGVNYGLDFIAENIEDNRNNVTRFALIGNAPPMRSGSDKTSLMFELPHEPGSLADATAVFKRNQLNLTWIESFPMPETPNEYLFFVEFQGHPDEAQSQQALAALRKKTVRLEVLGCYPATEPVE